MDDYIHGRTYIDPKHVQDGGVTPEHVRRWKLLQELQVRSANICYHAGSKSKESGSYSCAYSDKHFLKLLLYKK